MQVSDLDFRTRFGGRKGEKEHIVRRGLISMEQEAVVEGFPEHIDGTSSDNRF